MLVEDSVAVALVVEEAVAEPVVLVKVAMVVVVTAWW
jgi:hypothetical protein